MTDPSPGADRSDSDVTLYRPSVGGGLEPLKGERGDYRVTLRSRRWGAAPLENPEIEPSDPRFVLVAIVALLVVTFIAIVAGYATGFWG